MFFSKFPLRDIIINDEVKTFVDSFRYVDVTGKTEDLLAYDKIFLEDGERPDQLSTRLYGRPDFYWTFFIVNDNLKGGLKDWPLSDLQLEKEIEQEYTPYSVIQLPFPNTSETYVDYYGNTITNTDYLSPLPSFNRITNTLAGLNPTVNDFSELRVKISQYVGNTPTQTNPPSAEPVLYDHDRLQLVVKNADSGFGLFAGQQQILTFDTVYPHKFIIGGFTGDSSLLNGTYVSDIKGIEGAISNTPRSGLSTDSTFREYYNSESDTYLTYIDGQWTIHKLSDYNKYRATLNFGLIPLPDLTIRETGPDGNYRKSPASSITNVGTDTTGIGTIFNVAELNTQKPEFQKRAIEWLDTLFEFPAQAIGFLDTPKKIYENLIKNGTHEDIAADTVFSQYFLIQDDDNKGATSGVGTWGGINFNNTGGQNAVISKMGDAISHYVNSDGVEKSIYDYRKNGGEGFIPVTYQEALRNSNDEKKELLVLKPDVAEAFATEFERLIRQ